jgi:CDP-2,3-bis-(O-geranylgeranyl)-sn-glycerol synthase
MIELPFKVEISVCLICIYKSIALLIVSNGTPVIVNKVLGNRYRCPIDSGLKLSDGRRIFGNTKTWRGLCSSVFVTLAVAPLLNIDLLIGGLFGALAMLGDLVASFIKRRLERKESSRARGIDTVPESFLPVWFLKEPLALGTVDLIVIVGLFFLIQEFVSPILYKLNIRMRPY